MWLRNLLIPSFRFQAQHARHTLQPLVPLVLQQRHFGDYSPAPEKRFNEPIYPSLTFLGTSAGSPTHARSCTATTLNLDEQHSFCGYRSTCYPDLPVNCHDSSDYRFVLNIYLRTVNWARLFA